MELCKSASLALRTYFYKSVVDFLVTQDDTVMASSLKDDYLEEFFERDRKFLFFHSFFFRQGE